MIRENSEPKDQVIQLTPIKKRALEGYRVEGSQWDSAVIEEKTEKGYDPRYVTYCCEVDFQGIGKVPAELAITTRTENAQLQIEAETEKGFLPEGAFVGREDLEPGTRWSWSIVRGRVEISRALSFGELSDFGGKARWTAIDFAEALKQITSERVIVNPVAASEQP